MNRCKTCRFWHVEPWQDKGRSICSQTISEDGKPIVQEQKE